jgi:hypothetical protein
MPLSEMLCKRALMIAARLLGSTTDAPRGRYRLPRFLPSRKPT